MASLGPLLLLLIPRKWTRSIWSDALVGTLKSIFLRSLLKANLLHFIPNQKRSPNIRTDQFAGLMRWSDLFIVQEFLAFETHSSWIPTFSLFWSPIAKLPSSASHHGFWRLSRSVRTMVYFESADKFLSDFNAVPPGSLLPVTVCQPLS